MKKFYKTVTTAQNGDQGYKILLDGRAVKTPLKADLICPNAAIADLAVLEWAGQETEIIPDTMPVTQMVSTCMDKIPAERGTMTYALMRYLDTDLICYLADGEPPELLEMQKKTWTPWLEWFADRYGQSLSTTQDLCAIKQDQAAHDAVSVHIQSMDDMRFTILQMVVPACGSLVLALAFVDGAISPEDLLAAARVEERHKDIIYKADRHGPDPSIEKKDRILLRDFVAAQKILASLD